MENTHTYMYVDADVNARGTALLKAVLDITEESFSIVVLSKLEKTPKLSQVRKYNPWQISIPFCYFPQYYPTVKLYLTISNTQQTIPS